MQLKTAVQKNMATTIRWEAQMALHLPSKKLFLRITETTCMYKMDISRVMKIPLKIQNTNKITSLIFMERLSRGTTSQKKWLMT